MACATGNPKQNIPVTLTTDLAHLPAHVKDAFRLLARAAEHIDALYLFSRGQDMVAQKDIFDTSKPLRVWPEGLSREQLRDYLTAHPQESDAVLSPFTVVSQASDGRLVTTPYSEQYKKFLEPAAALIDEAAYLLGDYPKFQHFLKARAQSFRDNNFLASDADWVRATDGPIELIMGPMECYEDTLRNLKREFEGVVCFVPEDAERELGRFQESVRPFDEMLAMRYEYHSKSTLTPMRVVDIVAQSAEAKYRYTTMASNLPNDPEITENIGSKKTFFRQVIDAKVKHLVTPIIDRTFHPSAKRVPTGENYLHRTLGHELAHGLSFRFHGEEFGELAMPLEESKADVFGNLFLSFMEERGGIRHGDAVHGMVVHVGDIVRQVRFGLDDAHGAGALMQWNWLEHEHAISVEDGKLLIAEKRLEEAYQSLGDAFYKLSATKSESEARVFVGRWGKVPASLRELTKSIEDLPTDIDPTIEVKW